MYIRIVLLAGVLLAAPWLRAETTLEQFARLPVYEALEISPGGQYLAAIVIDQGELRESRLLVMDIENLRITADATVRGDDLIADIMWANDERVVGWVARKSGSLESPFLTGDMVAMNWDGSRKEWIYGARKGGGLLVNPDVVGGGLLSPLPDDPEHILLSSNDYSQRNGSFTEAIRVNVYSGRENRIARAPMRDAQLLADGSGNVRMAIAVDPDQNNEIKLFDRVDGDWILRESFDSRDGQMMPVAFGEDGSAYVLDNRETDTEALYRLDADRQELELVYTHPVVDIDRLHFAADGTVIGAYIEDGYPGYAVLDPDHPESIWFAQVRETLAGYRVQVTSLTDDGNRAILVAESDRLPATWFLYDVPTNGLSRIVSSLPDIDPSQMQPTQPFRLAVRDGVEVYGYVTRPAEATGPGPLVVMPHGGPHGVRDYWGFDAYVQMLASRGYSVLQVNFRGSGGYGREFLYAGYGRWGLEMQDDVTDATLWAIQAGLADPERICIFGGSYGGYAALMAVVKVPELYRCAIPYVGVYDLELMFEKGDIPDRESGLVYLRQAVGEDRQDLRARSPLYRLDALQAPLLIVHGGKDQRVPIEHAYRLREAMDELGKPYEWLVEEQEGHGFFNPENRALLFSRMIDFLDRHIGG